MAVPGVLVVEDNADIRETLVEILGDHGYEAIGASNGLEALQRLQQSKHLPSLILLDLMMPVMDGRAFRQEQLRHPHFAQIPVVALSAQRDVTESVTEMKVMAFLKKPLRMDELLGIAQRVCGQDGAP